MSQNLHENAGDPDIKQAMLDQTVRLINGVVDIWSIMYPKDDEAKWEEKFASFERDFNAACQQLYKREELLKFQLIYDTEEKLEEWTNLQKELGVTDYIRDDHPLTELHKELENALMRYRKMKEDRLKRLAILRTEERGLCECLGEEQKELSHAVPTDTDLDFLETRLYDLKLIKDERIKVLNPIKKRVQRLVKELGQQPDCPVTKSLFNTDSKCFKLTVDNINKLRETEELLLSRKEEKMACIDSLKAKLNSLWAIVQEPAIVQDEFLQLNTGLTDCILHRYIEEIRRVEDVVSKNIQKYVTSVRNEITELWDDMDFDHEERLKFHPFYTTTYTEDVLQIHQIERDKLRDLYKDHKTTAELAEKRQILRDRLKLMEEASKNKSRLYNRGGQLLKEEKERKCIHSNLPKIERQLQRSLTVYRDKHKRTFFWRGEDLLEIVLSDIENRDKISVKRNSYGPQMASPCVQYGKTPTKTGTPGSSNSHCRRPMTPLQPSPFRPYTAPLTPLSKRKITRKIF